MEILVIMLAIAGVSAFVLIMRTSLKRQQVQVTEQFEKRKLELHEKFIRVKERLQTLERERKQVEDELTLLKHNALTMQPAPVPKGLSPEEWLLATGQITPEQRHKVRNLMIKSKSALDFLGTCLILGFIDKAVSDAARRQASAS